MKRDYDVVDGAGDVVMIVRHLWPDDPVECCMCGDATPDHSHAVPYNGGPALEGQSEGGYRIACPRCYARWEAWNDAAKAAAASQAAQLTDTQRAAQSGARHG